MDALLPALLGALKLSAKLLLIVVPLVSLFEVLRYLPVFRRAGRAVEPMMRGMGLSTQAAVPLFAGIFLGIAYGAGIIIRVGAGTAPASTQTLSDGAFSGHLSRRGRGHPDFRSGRRERLDHARGATAHRLRPDSRPGVVVAGKGEGRGRVGQDSVAVGAVRDLDVQVG